MADSLVTVEYDRTTDWRRIRGLAQAIPSRFSARVDDPALPYVVDVDLVFDGERVQCEGLTCGRRDGGAPVTAEGMTRLRVADLIHRAAMRAVCEQSSVTPPGGRKARTVYTPYTPPAPQARTGRGVNATDLRDVATIYNVAHASGGSPRKAVMDAFDIPRTTAARWIRLAREQYLLSGDEGE